MQNTDKKIFSTKDLLLASCLVTLGFQYDSVTTSYEGQKNRPIGYWNFFDTEELSLARRQFNSGVLRIEPRALWQTLASLKSEVSSLQNNPITPLQ